ncbi:MAG: hypothetical protein II528_07795, partial [Lachnospiraceae bacterium]|nr:hypothetical protein [Lachnospiraceae bacterium]
NNLNKKSEGASLNTLFKLRSILINWLKDSDQDLEYTKFMTEKKLKYLMKNKEKSEARIKVLDSELKVINARKEELDPRTSLSPQTIQMNNSSFTLT